MAQGEDDRAKKRVRLMSEDEASSSDEAGEEDEVLKVNADFAKRFEHNKKREELHRLQEKYGDSVEKGASESDSESETEDDEAVLATEALDEEIFDVLNAIKTRDPRAYDKNVTFYKEPTQEAGDQVKAKAARPMRLQDYHREKLLSGRGAEEDEEESEEAPLPYNDEQAALKRDIVKAMHAAAEEDEDGETGSEEHEMFTRKEKVKRPAKKSQAVELDVAAADKDPETYLSNFMAARAWVPGVSSKFQPFESDDESDDARAEEFEHAYNMRFEDPARANEKLLTHSRQVAEKYSVRREDTKGRKKAREREKEAKEAAKREIEADKARLRKLKVDEAQEKLQRFKRVAGLHGKDISDKEWASFLGADWDDGQWNEEMAKRFGDDYYDEQDEVHSSDGEARKKLKKPKFDDDLDITDLVPSFDDDEEQEALQKYKLTDDEMDEAQSDGGVDLEQQESAEAGKHKRKKQVVEQMRRDQKRQARKERMKIEEMVDGDLVTDEAMLAKSNGGVAFRYRDTSPGAFGLSAREILMADDSQLNQYVGLKKLATFRDAEKKRKDKKRLGKKARLRQWRKDTFGQEDGPQMTFQQFLASRMPREEVGNGSSFHAPRHNGAAEAQPDKSRKKRSRRSKAKAEA